MQQKSGIVQFVHTTTVKLFLADFIKNPPTGISQQFLSHGDLAKTCLTYLEFKAFDEPCLDLVSVVTRAVKYKFITYAARYWGFHTKEAEDNRDVQKAVLLLFASQANRNSMLQMETYASSFWGNISVTKGQTLLHVVSRIGLATICSLILNGRLGSLNTYVSQSPLDVD
jgi:hypothetical protein